MHFGGTLQDMLLLDWLNSPNPAAQNPPANSQRILCELPHVSLHDNHLYLINMMISPQKMPMIVP